MGNLQSITTTYHPHYEGGMLRGPRKKTEVKVGKHKV